MNRRLKEYTREELEGKELVSMDFWGWGGQVNVRPLTNVEMKNKQINYGANGSSRVFITEVGLLKHSTVIVPAEDVEETFIKYKQAKAGDLDEKIKQAQEEKDKTLKLKLNYLKMEEVKNDN